MLRVRVAAVYSQTSSFTLVNQSTRRSFTTVEYYVLHFGVASATLSVAEGLVYLQLRGWYQARVEGLNQMVITEDPVHFK